MKATYTTKDKNLKFEIDGEIKDIWKQLSTVQEIFENTTCGCCKGTDVRFVHRVVDDNAYFEVVCLNQKCRAKLAMGQHKKNGTMFPKRKDEDGKWIPNNGWTIYKPGATESSGEESATPPKAQAKPASKTTPQGKNKPAATKTKTAPPPEPEDSGDNSGDDGSDEAPF